MTSYHDKLGLSQHGSPAVVELRTWPMTSPEQVFWYTQVEAFVSYHPALGIAGHHPYRILLIKRSSQEGVVHGRGHLGRLVIRVSKNASQRQEQENFTENSRIFSHCDVN